MAADDEKRPRGKTLKGNGKLFPIEPPDPVSAIYVELPIVSLAQMPRHADRHRHRFTSVDVGARCACGREIIEQPFPAGLMIVDAPMQIPRPQRAIHQRAKIGTGERPRRCHECRDPAIVAIDGEGHGDDLAAPAGRQEDVRAPALVGRRLVDLADVGPACRRAADVSRWG